MKMKIDELKKFIKEQAEKIISAGEPLDIEMNSMVKDEKGKSEALVSVKPEGGFEKKTATKSEGEATAVKMNKNDGEQGEKGAEVEVKAGSEMKGDSIEGLHKAKFDTKKDNPEVKTGEPFDEKVGEVKMNAQDKEGDSGKDAKTFVEPGAESKSGLSIGKAKPKFSEKAKNEKETVEKIAKGIQLPESFKSKKELLEFIQKEAKKISQVL